MLLWYTCSKFAASTAPNAFCWTLFHSAFCPAYACCARLNDDIRLVITRVAACVSPRVSASSSGMRTDSVVDCVENDSSAPSQSSPLVCVTTANEATSTAFASDVLTRISCIGSHVAPGIMYVSSISLAAARLACSVTKTVVSSRLRRLCISSSARCAAATLGVTSPCLRTASRRAFAVSRSSSLMNFTTSP